MSACAIHCWNGLRHILWEAQEKGDPHFSTSLLYVWCLQLLITKVPAAAWYQLSAVLLYFCSGSTLYGMLGHRLESVWVRHDLCDGPALSDMKSLPLPLYPSITCSPLGHNYALSHDVLAPLITQPKCITSSFHSWCFRWLVQLLRLQMVHLLCIWAALAHPVVCASEEMVGREDTLVCPMSTGMTCLVRPTEGPYRHCYHRSTNLINTISHQTFPTAVLIQSGAMPLHSTGVILRSHPIAHIELLTCIGVNSKWPSVADEPFPSLLAITISHWVS